MNTIDVYLQPLVDELMMLWRLGILALDYGKLEGSCGFILSALVLWTINDFLAYNLLSRCVHQGYMACLMCGPRAPNNILISKEFEESGVHGPLQLAKA